MFLMLLFVSTSVLAQGQTSDHVAEALGVERSVVYWVFLGIIVLIGLGFYRFYSN